MSADIVGFLYGILSYAVNFWWILKFGVMITLANSSCLQWVLYSDTPHPLSNTNAIYLWEQHCKQTVLGFYGTPKSFFFFLSHFGSLNYNAYFFVAIIIIIIYVIIIIVIIAFKCTTIFTQGTCQPPTTNAFWHHFWVWNKFAGPISMSWNRVSLRLNSVKNKYGVDIHNYVHYPQHILWLFDGWANLPSTTSVTNMIISSKLEYTSCFTSCPTTWDLRS